MAIGLAGAQAVRDALHDRQLEAGLRSGGEHEVGILAGQGKAEGDVGEGALHHRRALQLGVAEVERAALDGVEEDLGIDAQRLAEPERLGEHTDDPDHPAVDRDLGGRRGAGLAQPQGARTDGLEHRIDRRTGGLRAGSEDHEVPLFGRRAGPEHGRVDVGHIAIVGQLGTAFGALHADRAHLNPYIRRIGGRERLRGDIHHAVGVRQHRDHQRTAVGGAPRIVEQLGAVIGQGARPVPACGSRNGR